MIAIISNADMIAAFARMTETKIADTLTTITKSTELQGDNA